MFKNGTVVAITGTASGSGFQNFLVEWAPGLDPSSGWQTTGVTLSGGGSAPVSSGLLATWDTSSIGGPGYFTIRLTVNAANSPSQALTMLYLEPDLLSQGWPILLDEGPYFSAGVVPAVNSDGTLRLVLDSPQIFGPGFGEFWTISPDGSTQRSLLRARGSAQQPAVANLDGNPGDDAVLADSGNIEVFRQDNTSSTLSTSTLDYQRAQILIEDLVGDGHWETIALGSDFQNQVAYVSAWRANGSLLSAQFPIQIADQNPVNTWGNRVRVLAADLNGNGKKELIVQEGLSSTTFTLRLFASDGSPLTWKVPVLSGVPEAMAVADFDHNEKLETILVYYSGAQAIVDVFQPDGTERSGWPISLPNPNQNSESFLAVGDLNRDGRDEIVFSHETYLYVLNDDGTIFSNAWPLQTTEVGYGCVVIGDVDGDGYPEIVTTLNNVAYTNDPVFSQGAGGYYDQKLLAIRRDGTVSKSWQLTARNGYSLYVYPAPAIGDFNQDGITDIAVAYEVTGPSTGVPGVVTVVSTGAKFNPALNDWPLVHQNARNTNVAVPPADFTVSASDAPPVDAGASAIYTITVTPNPPPYNFAVSSFSCGNLPLGSACNFNPTSVTPGGNSATSTLSITTTSRTMAMAATRGDLRQIASALAVDIGVFGLVFVLLPRKKAGFATAFLMASALFAVAYLSGCGGSSQASQSNPNGTPAGSFQVTVSAMGNAGVSHATSMTLTVN